MNIIGAIACCVSAVNNYWTIMVGRFLFGVIAGILFCLVPKMILETLPTDEYNKGYGAITNIAIETFKVFFMICNFEYEFAKKAETELGIYKES